MRPVLALLRATLRSHTRDRALYLALVLFFVMGMGARRYPLSSWLHLGLPVVPDETRWTCVPEHVPPYVWAGGRPEWVRAESELARGFLDREVSDPEDADYSLVDVPGQVLDNAPRTDEGRRIEVVPLHASAVAAGLGPCLNRTLRESRHQWLLDRGIPETSPFLVEIDFPTRALSRGSRLFDLSTRGVGFLFAILVLSVGVMLESVPSARRSGWFEAAGTTPPGLRGVVWATWGTATLFGCLGCLLVSAGDAVAGALTGFPHPGATLAIVPFTTAFLSALGLAAVLRAEDAFGGAVRWMGWVVVLVLLAMASTALSGTFPTASALLPGGGLIAYTASALPEHLFLPAAASGVLTTAAILGWCLARAGSDSATPASDNGVMLGVITLFAVGMAGSVGWVAGIAASHAVKALVFSQVAFFLLPALATPRAFGIPFSETLRLKRPTPRAALLGPLCGVGGLAIASLGYKAYTRLFSFESSLLYSYLQAVQPLTQGVGVVAASVCPAVCEEILFRGAILGLLVRRVEPWKAVCIQALLFGLAHVVAFKFLPTGLFGLLMGVLVLRSGSLVPAMLAHATMNVLALATPQWLERAEPYWIPIAVIGFLLAFASGPLPSRRAR